MMYVFKHSPTISTIIGALMCLSLIACTQSPQPDEKRSGIVTDQVANQSPQVRILVGAFASPARAHDLAAQLEEHGYTTDVVQRQDSNRGSHDLPRDLVSGLTLVWLRPPDVRASYSQLEAERVVSELARLGFAASIYYYEGDEEKRQTPNEPDDVNSSQTNFALASVQQTCSESNSRLEQSSSSIKVTAGSQPDLLSITSGSATLLPFAHTTSVPEGLAARDGVNPQTIRCQTESSCGCVHTDMCYSIRIQCCDWYNVCYDHNGNMVSKRWINHTCPNCCTASLAVTGLESAAWAEPIP
jgi:hypothetical protein